MTNLCDVCWLTIDFVVTFGEKTALPLGLSVYDILLEFSHAYTATVTGGRKILKIDKER